MNHTNSEAAPKGASVSGIVAFSSRAYGLELKSPGGRLSPAQRDVLDTLRAAGATVSVAYGLDAALAHLEAWDLLRGGGPKRFLKTTPDAYGPE